MKKRKITQTLIKTLLASAITLTGLVNHAHARQQPDQTGKWYQVNLIIFANKNTGNSPEQWQPVEDLKRTFPASTIALEAPNTEQETIDPGFLQRPVIEKSIKNAALRLKNSNAYQILYEASWTQPGLSKKKAVPILIQAGKRFGNHYELEGTVTLSVSRYLHFKTNLWLGKFVQQVELDTPWWQNPLYEPISVKHFDEDVSQGIQLDSEISLNNNLALNTSEIHSDSSSIRYEAIRMVPMTISRRMRSNEIHYLDNPLFGVLVSVTPSTKPLDYRNKPKLSPPEENNTATGNAPPEGLPAAIAAPGNPLNLPTIAPSAAPPRRLPGND
jgi:hypothetical protein